MRSESKTFTKKLIGIIKERDFTSQQRERWKELNMERKICNKKKKCMYNNTEEVTENRVDINVNRAKDAP